MEVSALNYMRTFRLRGRWSALVSGWLAVVTAAAAQGDGTLRWAFTTLSTSTAGTILSSPAIGADGTIYGGVEVGTASSASPSGQLLALSPAGTQKWAFTPPSAPDWIGSTPAIARDGTLIIGCWNGRLYAVRADGTLRWELKVGAFVASSPALAPDGTIYVGAGSDLVAVTADGALKWSFPAGDWIDASPALGADGTIYVGSWDGNFYAVKPDGTEQWRFSTDDNIATSAAIAADGTIYFGSRDTAVYAVGPDGGLKWKFETNDTLEASPVIGGDGTIYVATTGGRVLALNRDGAPRWQFPSTAEPALKPIYSTPAVRADGSLVFGSSNDALYALRVDGTLLWRAALSGSGLESADSSPAVAADGTIYIGCSDKKLYAFNGSAAPLATDWPQFRRDSRRNGWTPLGAAAGTTGRLVNLSVRTFAGTEADTLIVGFFVAGSGARSLLLRGVGPTLTNFGVSGVVANPQIAAFAESTPLFTNDDWMASGSGTDIASAGTSVGAFPLASNLDAALYRDFAPGAYSVQVSGAGGATGVALMEAYDVMGGPSSRLSNVSARSAVGTDAGILIAGFTIRENTRAVLVRGAGPALAAFGVTGALANPQLKIFDGAQLVAENDNWSAATNAAALTTASTGVGAFPLATGSLDAALLLTLPPGSYTAQVAGVNNTTGVALVEVYEVP